MGEAPLDGFLVDWAATQFQIQKGGIAHQVAVALFDDVANMDADAKNDAPVFGYAGIAFDHCGQHFDGAARRVDNAAELDDAPSPVRLTTRP